MRMHVMAAKVSGSPALSPCAFLLETGSLTEPGARLAANKPSSCACVTCAVPGSCVALCPRHVVLGSQVGTATPSFYTDSHATPHTWVASALTTEPPLPSPLLTYVPASDTTLNSSSLGAPSVSSRTLCTQEPRVQSSSWL